MKLRFMAIGLLAALALLAAACGGGGASAPDLSGVAAAAEKTEDAGTARFELSMDVSALPGATEEATFKGEGAVDYERNRFRMTIDIEGLAGLLGQSGQDSEDTSIELRADGTAVYMKFPVLAGLFGGDKPWLKFDLEKLGEAAGIDPEQLQQLNQGNPKQALSYLRAAGEFDEVGKEDVRGVETTHYRGTIDLREGLEKVSGSAKEQLARLLEDADVTEFPADAWIDGEGFLRKLSFRFPAPQGSDAALAMTMELFDLGAPVDIELPPADQVTDITDLITKGTG